MLRRHPERCLERPYVFADAELDPVMPRADLERLEPELRNALLSLQDELRERADRAVLVVVAGVDGAGKGSAINLLSEWMDPRGIRTLKETVIERARDGAAILISSHLLALVEDLCTHLLILHHGRSLFFGRKEDARAAVAAVDPDTTLEEVFFRATETKPM